MRLDRLFRWFAQEAHAPFLYINHDLVAGFEHGAPVLFDLDNALIISAFCLERGQTRLVGGIIEYAGD